MFVLCTETTQSKDHNLMNKLEKKNKSINTTNVSSMSWTDIGGYFWDKKKINGKKNYTEMPVQRSKLNNINVKRLKIVFWEIQYQVVLNVPTLLHWL